MVKTLRKIFFALVLLSLPLGFLVEHDQASFWWHHIPSLEGIVGGAGTLLLLVMMKIVAFLASTKEDFYD
jgi:hypothetical protein